MDARRAGCCLDWHRNFPANTANCARPAFRSNTAATPAHGGTGEILRPPPGVSTPCPCLFALRRPRICDTLPPRPQASAMDVQPAAYHLLFQPQPDNSGRWAQICGRATIALQVLRTTRVITLNALDLTIATVKLRLLDHSDTVAWLLPAQTQQDIGEETVSFFFTEDLPAGITTELVIDYEARVYADGEYRGVYECAFFKRGHDAKAVEARDAEIHPDDDDVISGLVTHFEPCDARRAFPCLDEPHIKAPFTVEMIVPSLFQVISNMPVDVLEPNTSVSLVDRNSIAACGESGSVLQRVKFLPTPPTSTYLVCFIVGIFDFIERTVVLDYDTEGVQTKSPLQVRIYTPVGESQSGEFALDLAERALTSYCDAFQCGYPLPKMDIVGVPFLDALAMENWGALVFVQSYLLVDSETPLSRKQRIARLVFHEVLHQWMGNLVSIKHWKYLWVKEGFARYLEYVLVDKFFPEWRYWGHFLTQIYATSIAMDEDINGTHAVEVDVPSARDILTIFDSISYGKGAAILCMLAQYLGQDVMWKALRYFIHKHRFGAAGTEDLWEALKYACDGRVDVSALMAPWIKTPGHPILHIEEVESEKENAARYKVTQCYAHPLDPSFSELNARHFFASPFSSFPVPPVIKTAPLSPSSSVPHPDFLPAGDDDRAFIADAGTDVDKEKKQNARSIAERTGERGGVGRDEGRLLAEDNGTTDNKNDEDEEGIVRCVISDAVSYVEVPDCRRHSNVEEEKEGDNHHRNNTATMHEYEDGEYENNNAHESRRWVSFNWNHSGFYRVCYSRRMWSALAGAIRRRELSAVNVLGVLMDAFALNSVPPSVFDGDPRRGPKVPQLHVGADVILELLVAFAGSAPTTNHHRRRIRNNSKNNNNHPISRSNSNNIEDEMIRSEDDNDERCSLFAPTGHPPTVAEGMVWEFVVPKLGEWMNILGTPIDADPTPFASSTTAPSSSTSASATTPAPLNIYQLFSRLICTVYGDVAQRIGWWGTRPADETVDFLRNELFYQLAQCNDRKVMKCVDKYFRRFFSPEEDDEEEGLQQQQHTTGEEGGRGEETTQNHIYTTTNNDNDQSATTTTTTTTPRRKRGIDDVDDHRFEQMCAAILKADKELIQFVSCNGVRIGGAKAHRALVKFQRKLQYSGWKGKFPWDYRRLESVINAALWQARDEELCRKNVRMFLSCFYPSIASFCPPLLGGTSAPDAGAPKTRGAPSPSRDKGKERVYDATTTTTTALGAHPTVQRTQGNLASAVHHASSTSINATSNAPDDSRYFLDRPPMGSYINLHACLRLWEAMVALVSDEDAMRRLSAAETRGFKQTLTWLSATVRKDRKKSEAFENAVMRGGSVVASRFNIVIMGSKMSRTQQTWKRNNVDVIEQWLRDKFE